MRPVARRGLALRYLRMLARHWSDCPTAMARLSALECFAAIDSEIRAGTMGRYCRNCIVHHRHFHNFPCAGYADWIERPCLVVRRQQRVQLVVAHSEIRRPLVLRHIHALLATQRSAQEAAANPLIRFGSPLSGSDSFCIVDGRDILDDCGTSNNCYAVCVLPVLGAEWLLP